MTFPPAADALVLHVAPAGTGETGVAPALERAGFRVVRAGPDQDLPALVERLAPRLVLLGAAMPEEVARGLAARLRGQRPETVVLRLAGEPAAGTGPESPPAPPPVVSLAALLALAGQGLAAERLERQRAEARAQALYHRIPVPLHGLDPAGRLLLVSDRWLELLGYPAREAVIGRHITEFLMPESGRQFADVWPRVLRGGRVDDLEIQLRRQDGRPLDALLSVRAEQDAAGRFLRSLTVLVDIAARKRAEAGLIQAQKMEVFGQIAGGIAHDMNNVLQTVVSGSRVLGGQAEDPEMVRRLAGLIGEAGTRGAAIARRLLSFARRGELRITRVDVAALLEDVREVLGSTLGRRTTVRLENPPEPGAFTVMADREQLETVLLNLAINARDAMPEGGEVTLSATSPAAGMVEILVADHGTGMDAATLARATEPFFTTKAQGTGLGLAMAQSFAAQSGGGLRIDTAPGQGTRVLLRLPLAGAEAAAQEPTAAGPPRARLLVVDDDPLIRTVLGEVFQGLGHEAELLAEGRAALRRLAEGAHCDLLLTDLAMPDISGLEVLRQARRLMPGLPCILLTGNLHDAASAALTPFSDGGPFTVLRKPVAPDALAAAVNSLLADKPPRGPP